ncbi:hypothetical protein RclHR1_14130004 [Rhizophagus clarus]|uniref:Uncharacterized protein n=1 Tax=Rhizophagus clarus TaxID=94130 RepID=A0A2Z6QBU7_9GLOM|nr:hypothetical protein RclHR1_14130004 [Rhizophagus clarus]
MKNLSQKIQFSISKKSYHSLLSNCSNTLSTIIFYRIEFKSITILNEVLDQLKVLMLIFLLNSNFIKQIINNNKPFKLKSLIFDEKITN